MSIIYSLKFHGEYFASVFLIDSRHYRRHSYCRTQAACASCPRPGAHSSVMVTSASDFIAARCDAQARPMSSCGVGLSVCVSVTFVDCVKTHIFEIVSPSCSQTILVFPYQTGWRYSDANPLTGTSNAGGLGRIKSRFWAYMPAVNAATGDRCCQHGRRWNTATIIISRKLWALVVHCGYSITKRHARQSHRLRGSTARERPSALSH